MIRRVLLLHLPLAGVLLIYGFIWMVEEGVIEGLRNESTFGWMLILWYPLASLLALLQIILWIAWIVKRRNPRG